MGNHLFGASDAADSAGQPWAGRSFDANPHAGDDGRADDRVLAAIAAFRELSLTDSHRPHAQSDVIDAIAASRLLMPLIAEAGDTGVAPNGLVVDKTQELALVTVAGPGGQKVMPAFTSVEAMSQWRPDARPVPVDARRAALAAVAEGVSWIVLDPVSPTEFVLRRPALEAIAKGEKWTAPHLDDDIQVALRKGVDANPFVRSIRTVAGDPDARGMTDEVLLQIVLIPGLSHDEVTRTLQGLSAVWADEVVLAERIDSMKIQVIPGA